jgi:hypothetical protein
MGCCIFNSIDPPAHSNNYDEAGNDPANDSNRQLVSKGAISEAEEAPLQWLAVNLQSQFNVLWSTCILE